MYNFQRQENWHNYSNIELNPSIYFSLRCCALRVICNTSPVRHEVANWAENRMARKRWSEKLTFVGEKFWTVVVVVARRPTTIHCLVYLSTRTPLSFHAHIYQHRIDGRKSCSSRACVLAALCCATTNHGTHTLDCHTVIKVIRECVWRALAICVSADEKRVRAIAPRYTRAKLMGKQSPIVRSRSADAVAPVASDVNVWCWKAAIVIPVSAHAFCVGWRAICWNIDDTHLVGMSLTIAIHHTRTHKDSSHLYKYTT